MEKFPGSFCFRVYTFSFCTGFTLKSNINHANIFSSVSPSGHLLNILWGEQSTHSILVLDSSSSLWLRVLKIKLGLSPQMGCTQLEDKSTTVSTNSPLLKRTRKWQGPSIHSPPLILIRVKGGRGRVQHGQATSLTQGQQPKMPQ